MPDASPAIRTDDLRKTYRSGLTRTPVEALRGVSLTVEPGEIFGLLGPNGAGKTTLVKILLGVVHASGGSARLFGRPAGTPEARVPVGYLPENHNFPSFLTPTTLLDLYGRLAGVSSSDRTRRIPELLERVGLGDRQTSTMGEFSKGMLQRAGLAQALLSEPKLLFLDEPTDGVDPLGRREIRDLLVWLRAEGVTVFLNSHLLSEVEQVCSRVAILNDGRLVRQGTIDELTAEDRTYTLTSTAIPVEVMNATRESIRAAADDSETEADALRTYRLRAQDRADLNALLDRLRSAGVEIEALAPVRRSLEDYFIDVVEGERASEKERGGREAMRQP